ncbi:MAG: hypothetical protein ABMB14_15540, partial [Myxococcota bacterium]
LLASDARALRAGFRGRTRSEVAEYVRAARRSGLRGPIDYYRAAARDALFDRTPPARVEAETLVIWGADEPVFEPRLAEPPPSLVPRARVERIAGAGHAVQQDAPERVTALLLDHLR